MPACDPLPHSSLAQEIAAGLYQFLRDFDGLQNGVENGIVAKKLTDAPALALLACAERLIHRFPRRSPPQIICFRQAPYCAIMLA